MLQNHDIHGLESPIPPFGSSSDFSLGENYLAFVAKDPHLNPATNTASHVYVVSYEDEKWIEQVNRGQGASSEPAWSPDGEWLAFLEMRIRGYESDRKSPSFTPISLHLHLHFLCGSGVWGFPFCVCVVLCLHCVQS